MRHIISTSNAIEIEKNYKEINTLLIKYKQKLDKRNPWSFKKDWQKSLVVNMKNNDNITLYNLKDNYSKYLKHTFNIKSDIKNRNDTLIVGLYKLLYLSYGFENKKLTALSYNLKNLQEFSKVIQIVRWKIAHSKDDNNKYLFLTWQNNWQVELLQKTNKKNPNYSLIKDLRYIKNKKESVFNSSNMSFENIISKILYINNDSIKRLGGEPNELAVEFLKFFVFL